MFRKITLISVAFLIVLVTVFTGINLSAKSPKTDAAKTAAEAQKDNKNQATKLTKEELLKIQPSDVILGDKKAKVTIIEYASLTCPHCADFSNKVLPEITEKYINTGKVKFVHRDFPLNEPAIRAAMAAKCVGEKRYYSFIKAFFQSQKNWAFTADFKESLKNIAKLGGLSSSKFDECMANKKLEEAILESRLNAEKVLEVKSTPTFFINGEKIAGNKDFDNFSKEIEKALAAAK